MKALLSRDFTSEIGKNCTVYLPFALDAEQASSLGTFYRLSSVGEGSVTMESVTETEANMAYMFKPASSLTNITASMVELKTGVSVPIIGAKMMFVGTYKPIINLVSTTEKQYYCFMSTGSDAGKFVHVTSAVNISPFRAYMELVSGASLGRSLDIDFGDGTTGIKNLKVGVQDNVYYDLQGRRVLYPKKGIYILNGKKVIIK